MVVLLAHHSLHVMAPSFDVFLALWSMQCADVWVAIDFRFARTGAPEGQEPSCTVSWETKWHSGRNRKKVQCRAAVSAMNGVIGCWYLTKDETWCTRWTMMNPRLLCLFVAVMLRLRGSRLQSTSFSMNNLTGQTTFQDTFREAVCRKNGVALSIGVCHLSWCFCLIVVSIKWVCFWRDPF